MGTAFMELDDDGRAAARQAFRVLADEQKGAPEILATSIRANPGMFHGMGAFSYLAEHIGDLTHRMSDGCEHTCFGFSMVQEKVARALRYFRNGYGLEREVDGNVRNNWRCDQDNPARQCAFEAYRAAFVAGSARYADAHAALTVWNRAQWHGREAAVALGRLDYAMLERHLEVIERHLDEGPEHWAAWAGQVDISPHGEVLAYAHEDASPPAAPAIFR